MQYLKIIIFYIIAFSILGNSSVFSQDTDSVYSQKTKKEKIPTIGIALTGTTYVGDYTDNLMKFNRIYPGMNVSLQSDISNKSFLQAQLNAGFGSITEQADAYPYLLPHSKTIRNISYIYTPFYYGDVRLKTRFLHNCALRPYLSTGVGLYLFSPQDQDGNLLVEAPKTRPKGEVYKTAAFYVPAVVGFDLRVNKMLGLGLNYTYRNIFTDYTDNVGQLGKMKGNDKLHQLQLTAYITPAPLVKEPKPIKIYIPPTDASRMDSSILADNKPIKKHKRHKIKPIEEPEDTAAYFFQPRPLTSLELSLLDTTPQPQRVVRDRISSDSVRIFLDSAVFVKDSFQIYPASHKYETQKTISITENNVETKTEELLKSQENVHYMYQNISKIDTTDTFNIYIWKYISGQQLTENQTQAAKEKIEALEKEAIDNRRYIYYEVKNWDSWENILKIYGVQKLTIMRLNNMTNGHLQGGMTLRIPDISK